MPVMRYTGEIMIPGEDDRQFYYITRAELLKMIRNLRDGDTLVINTAEES